MQHATINISPLVSRTLGLGPEWKVDRATIGGSSSHRHLRLPFWEELGMFRDGGVWNAV